MSHLHLQLSVFFHVSIHAVILCYATDVKAVHQIAPGKRTCLKLVKFQRKRLWMFFFIIYSLFVIGLGYCGVAVL